MRQELFNQLVISGRAGYGKVDRNLKVLSTVLHFKLYQMTRNLGNLPVGPY
jgi:hypothetical protein